MPVSKYATAAGKKYESDLMKYLRARGNDVERLRLAGAEDEGDLLLRTAAVDRVVIEAKREKGFKLGPWLKEAEAEMKNYNEHRGITFPTGFVVIHHARGKNIGKGYVTTSLDEWLRQVGA